MQYIINAIQNFKARKAAQRIGCNLQKIGGKFLLVERTGVVLDGCLLTDDRGATYFDPWSAEQVTRFCAEFEQEELAV